MHRTKLYFDSAREDFLAKSAKRGSYGTIPAVPEQENSLVCNIPCDRQSSGKSVEITNIYIYMGKSDNKQNVVTSLPCRSRGMLDALRINYSRQLGTSSTCRFKLRTNLKIARAGPLLPSQFEGNLSTMN